jgi:hypothetical protein
VSFRRPVPRAALIALGVLVAFVAFGPLGLEGAAWAHVGSPQVTAAGRAGPYRLTVMVTPPARAPGVASVEVDAGDDAVRAVRLWASPLGAPEPEPGAAVVARRSGAAGARFAAELWIASPASWRLVVAADGDGGAGQLSVLVPQPRRIGAALRVSLVALRILFALGLAALMGRTARGARGRRRTAATVLAAAAFVGVAVWLGGGVPPADCAARALDASVAAGRLTIRLPQPALACGSDARRLVPDHGHPMHLFLVRLPGLDRLLHLHPTAVEGQFVEGRFVEDVPERSEGRYQIFADVVDATGAPSTALGEVTLPAAPGAQLAGDDAAGEGLAIDEADSRRTAAPLPDGARLVWDKEEAPLRSGHLAMLAFHVEDARGARVQDLQPYMGMLGHAIVLRHDRAVFAHVHPTGSVPMAASAALGGRERGGGGDVGGHAGACPMPGMAAPASSSVTFPYGFPSAGTYRIFVQIKRGGRVETGVFDARVDG